LLQVFLARERKFLDEAKAKVRFLFRNMLPDECAKRIEAGANAYAEIVEGASIIFIKYSP
jgi:hypothetical protein